MSNTPTNTWQCSTPGCTREAPTCRAGSTPAAGSPAPRRLRHMGTGLPVCIEFAQSILDSAISLEASKRSQDGRASSAAKLLDSPEAIAQAINASVDGQSLAVQRFSQAMYDSMIARELRKGNVSVDKSNVFMPGPTGCGKTYIVQTAAKLLDQPLLVYRGTAGLTKAGYVGKDVEDIASDYYVKVQEWMNAKNANSGNDPEAVAKWIKENGGFIAIDEIDKIAANKGAGLDVGGESVQDRLLTFIEGEEVGIRVQDPRNPAGGRKVVIDTTNIMFVMLGAFSPGGDADGDSMAKRALVDIVEARLGNGGAADRRGGQRVDAKKGDLFLYAEEDDFVKYGFKPEFVGRIFGYYAPLRQLREDNLLNILTKIKGNAVDKQKAYFSKVGVALGGQGYEIIFEQDALKEIARKAASKGTGARALVNVLQETLKEVKFKAPGLASEYNQITITADLVKKIGKIDGENGVPFATVFRKKLAAAFTPIND